MASRGGGPRAQRDGGAGGADEELEEQQATQALQELRGAGRQALSGREGSPGRSGGAAPAGLGAYRPAAGRSGQGGGLERSRAGSPAASGPAGSGPGGEAAAGRPRAARGSQGGSGQRPPEPQARGAPSLGAPGFGRAPAVRRSREASPGGLEQDGRRVQPRPRTPAEGGLDSGDEMGPDDVQQHSGHGESEMEEQWGREGGDYSSLTGQHVAELGDAMRGGYVAGQRRQGGDVPRGSGGEAPLAEDRARGGAPRTGHSSSREPAMTAAPARPRSAQPDRARREGQGGRGQGSRDSEGVTAGTEAEPESEYEAGAERHRRGGSLPPQHRAPGGPQPRLPGEGEEPGRDWDPGAGYWPLGIPEGGAPLPPGQGRWGSEAGVPCGAGRGPGSGGGAAGRSPSHMLQEVPQHQGLDEEQRLGSERAAAAMVAKGLTGRSGVTLAPFVAGAVEAFKREMHGPRTEEDSRPRWQAAMDAIKEGAETVYRDELARAVSQFQSCLRMVGKGDKSVGEWVQQVGQRMRKGAEDMWDDKWKDAVKAAFADGRQPTGKYSCSYILAGFLSQVDCAQWVEEQILQTRFPDAALDSRLEKFRSVFTVQREVRRFQPAPASWAPEMVEVTPQGIAMRRLADAMDATQEKLGDEVLRAERKEKGGGGGRRQVGSAGEGVGHCRAEGRANVGRGRVRGTAATARQRPGPLRASRRGALVRRQRRGRVAWASTRRELGSRRCGMGGTPGRGWDWLAGGRALRATANILRRRWYQGCWWVRGASLGGHGPGSGTGGRWGQTAPLSWGGRRGRRQGSSGGNRGSPTGGGRAAGRGAGGTRWRRGARGARGGDRAGTAAGGTYTPGGLSRGCRR